MAYGENEVFVKVKNGVEAPAGFHYMPNGRLMSDADHIAVHGYIERTISSLNVDTIDILNAGETRTFSIQGQNGAVFSLEIYDDTGKYYNFDTRTWSTTETKLSKKSISGVYNIDVKFDALPDDDELKLYTVNLFAETAHNIKTIHAPLVEVRNADNSINVNESTGSNSNILTRIIYQDSLKTLKLSAIAPSLYLTSADTVNGATSSSNKIIIDGDATDTNVVKIGDKVTTTGIASSVHALVTGIDPDGDNTHEIEISVVDSASNDAAITFTPPFNGMTPHGTDSDTGASSTSVSTGGATSVSFSVTISALSGRTFRVLRTPTVDDLCVFKTVTFGSAALAIEGEDTSSSTYYRWPIDNIANLQQGMILDPARSGTGANTTANSSISNYRTTTTNNVIKQGAYENYLSSVTVDDVVVDAVDAYGNEVTAIDRNGKTTAQAGNIIFNNQQADALKSDSGVRIFAYGKDGVKALTGIDVDLRITSMAYAGSTNPVRDAVSTTTSGAVSSSTTIGLAEVGNISQGMTVSGVGISAAAADPYVVSKNAVSGAGNIIVSAAQTLESGQTLYFNGGAGSMTIRGNLEISNMALTDTSIFFDVERFLTAV